MEVACSESERERDGRRIRDLKGGGGCLSSVCCVSSEWTTTCTHCLSARAVAGMGFKGWGSDEERGSQHLRDSSRLVRIKKLEQEM